MKIVVADKISPHGVELLGAAGWKVVLPAPPDLPREIADADALIVRSATRVTDDLLSHAPKLRIVGRAGVGVDNIDMDAATRRGVLVVNTPGGNAASVAEHALALMLSLARSIPQLNAALHAGRWEKSGAAGAELRGKTLGLVGLGRVGAEVARRARALEMRVLAYDPYITPERAAEWGVELLPLAGHAGQGRLRFAAHGALSGDRPNDERRAAGADEARRAARQYGARRTGGRSGAGRGAALRASGRRGAGCVCRRAAEAIRRCWRCPTSSPRRTWPARPPRRRKKLACRSRSRCATICPTACCATPSICRRFRPSSIAACGRIWNWPSAWPRWPRRLLLSRWDACASPARANRPSWAETSCAAPRWPECSTPCFPNTSTW